MKMNAISRTMLPILLLITLVVSALAAPAAGTVSARQSTTLLIGYLGAPESDTANGARLAIDQINSLGAFTAADGVAYTLELVTLAETPTAETFASGVTALAAQNVVALLGPDNNAILTPENVNLLISTGLPVLTGVTTDGLTDSDPSDVLLRTRAPEEVYTNALASVMIDDLGLTSIALVHTSTESTQSLLTYLSAMDERGISAAAKVQLSEASGLLAETQTLVDLNPEAIVMWGPYEDAASMLSVLRKRGWQGTFAYRWADEAARAGVLDSAISNGVLGVTSWSYAYPGRSARVFLDDYVKAFGAVPGPLAAAAYDTMWYLRLAIMAGGTNATAVRSEIISGAPLALVGGELYPATYANGDLLHVAMVYALGPGGGPTVIAQFSDNTRLAIENVDQ